MKSVSINIPQDVAALVAQFAEVSPAAKGPRGDTRTRARDNDSFQTMK